MSVPETVKFHESTQAQISLLSERVRGWIQGDPIPDDQELLLEALRLARKLDPLQLLSFATLQAFAGERSDSGYLGERRVQQCHLELFQGLVLTLPLGNYSRSAIMTDENSSEIFELIRDSLLAFSINFHKDEYTGSDQKDAASSIINDARLETLFVRNQAFAHQSKILVSRLFTSLDAKMKSDCGFSADELMDFVLAVLNEVNARASRYYSKLEIIRHQSSRKEIWQEFCNQFGLSEADKKRYREKFDPNLDEQGLFNALHTATSKQTTRIFSFSFKQLKRLFPSKISDIALRALLDSLSLKFGDLRSFDKNFFFLGNPVWIRPVVKLSDNEYYFAALGEFFSFPIEILLSVLSNHPRIIEQFHRDKGEILESWISDEIRKYFQASDIYRNVERTKPIHGEDGENDIVVFVDRLLLLIEAKAGEAEPGALRGGYKAIKASLKHLAVEPGKQSDGLIRFLKNNPGPQKFATSDTDRDFVIDFNDVRRIVRVSITLDGLGLLAAKLHRLETAGIAGSSWRPAPCISLLDFLMCTELLDAAPVLLHYLVCRETIEGLDCWRADEQDFLSLYMKGLFPALTPADGLQHEHYGESKFVFDYFYDQFKGTPSSKPRLRLSDTWVRLIEVFASMGANDWTESAFLLLSVPQKVQQDIESHIQLLNENARSAEVTTMASFFLPKSDLPDLAPSILAYAACPDAEAMSIANQTLSEQSNIRKPTLVVIVDTSSDYQPVLDYVGI